MATTSSDSRFSVFLQEAGLLHQYIRSKDTSNIVERPERLRAVNVGVSAALSRLGALQSPREAVVKAEQENGQSIAPTSDADDLTAALEQLNISTRKPSPSTAGFFSRPENVIRSTASADILNHPAVKFVHGDIGGDVYLENLVKWTKESREAIAKRESEIPAGLSQGDLYLCPQSIQAIQGALGTVCEAVDSVVQASRGSSSTSRRAFVAVRPPGHHCGEDTPCGFCFVNNVAVAAAHAHLKHGINRVLILDIDLHHGNGTQSIIWQINEETYRATLETSAGSASAKPGPQIYYGSIHDILSFPCEDGKLELVQAASTSIHGPHGQYIENIHLQTYNSEKEFYEELYAKRYLKLLSRGQEFLDATGGPGDDVLVFISAGFDACEHEYESMQRHHRRVPTSFFHRFTRETCMLADKYARGRVVSVLEGGYSDRALTSGVFAHLVGMSGVDAQEVDERWWGSDNLVLLEQATKKRRGARMSQAQQPQTSHPEWLLRTLDIFSTIDTVLPTAKSVVPASSMSLRERPSRSSSAANINPAASAQREKGIAKSNSGETKYVSTTTVGVQEVVVGAVAPADDELSAGTMSNGSSDGTGRERSGSRLGSTQPVTSATVTEKKLPRVILRVRPRDPPRSAGVVPALLGGRMDQK